MWEGGLLSSPCLFVGQRVMRPPSRVRVEITCTVTLCRKTGSGTIQTDQLDVTVETIQLTGIEHDPWDSQAICISSQGTLMWASNHLDFLWKTRFMTSSFTSPGTDSAPKICYYLAPSNFHPFAHNMISLSLYFHHHCYMRIYYMCSTVNLRP